MSSPSNPVQLPNAHLQGMTSDFLFHLGISLDDLDTVTLFSKVKFVCVGGTASRMRTLAQGLGQTLYHWTSARDHFDFSFSNDRYSGYLVGAVFCVNHGIGAPSLSVVLHEVCKLLQRAQCCDVTLIRIGTCGGIGLPNGTVVISDGVLSAGLEPVYRTSSLGQPLNLPVVVNQQLVTDILAHHCPDTDHFRVVRAKTYSSDDFYQGQGRLDGAFCEYSREGQRQFFQQLHALGVRNIEMEAAALLAFAHRVAIKAAVVCVTLVNRLEADIPDAKEEVQNFPILLVTRYIRACLGLEGPTDQTL